MPGIACCGHERRRRKHRILSVDGRVQIRPPRAIAVHPQPPPRMEHVCSARGTRQSFRRTFASVCIPAPARGTSLIKAPIDQATPAGTARQSPSQLSGGKSPRRAAYCDAAVQASCSHAAFGRSGMRSRSNTDLIEFGPCVAPPNIEVPVQIENMCVDPDMGSLCFGAHNAVDFFERGRLVEHGKLLSHPPDGGGGIEQFLAIKVD